MKNIILFLPAICTQLIVCVHALFFSQIRSVLKVYPSLFLFLLLDILPYFFIGLFLCMTGFVHMTTKRGSNQLLIPLFFIIFNILLLALYFLGMLPLSSSSLILPILLIGYSFGRLIYLRSPNT